MTGSAILSKARRDAIREANRETVVTTKPFTGLSCYCMFCRLVWRAPWLPATCPRCEKLMTVEV